MHVLLIKLSSMGDIIHTLPALTDAMHARPGIKFTWLVDASFAEIPAWHPAVDRVIPIELRNRNLRQILSTIKQLRSDKYDLIIDAQGLFKSVFFARLARGRQIVGLSYRSCREPFASLFYTRKIIVDWEQHAIDRQRQLFAAALNYQLPNTTPMFDLQVEKFEVEPNIFFLHGTTWESKHWPDEYWLRLIDLVVADGYMVKVTWATAEQRARAQRFAQHSNKVIVLPHMTLNQASRELNSATGIVAVDTGFAHLGAALDKPLVALFGATDMVKASAKGIRSTNLRSHFSCSPCMQRECRYTGHASVKPACMQELEPENVWNILRLSIINSK